MSIVLYTPVYCESPGTQFRVDMIQRSLEMSGYDTLIIRSKIPNMKKLYDTVGEELITLEAVWKAIGLFISRLIYKYKPETAILFLDVTASAIPFLKKFGIKTILSIEDLTPEYMKYSSKASEKFYKLLIESADQADLVISPSYTLSQKLKYMGLKNIPVLVGLEPYVSYEDAIARTYPPIILHTGRLNIQKQVDIIFNLAERYKLLVHEFGKFANKLNHHNIIKYKTSTPEKAASLVKRAHAGLIIEYRDAYTLTRIYFHLAMLQPIIMYGKGSWIKEISFLGLNTFISNEICKIFQNYESYVKIYFDIQKKLAVPNVHEPLLKEL